MHTAVRVGCCHNSCCHIPMRGCCTAAYVSAKVLALSRWSAEGGTLCLPRRHATPALA